jgi:hypothetical protein
MNTPPLISKTHHVKGRFSKVILESLYDYIESLEKRRQERDAKLQIQLDSLEKRSEERDVKLQIELETMLDKKKLNSSKTQFKHDRE